MPPSSNSSHSLGQTPPPFAANWTRVEAELNRSWEWQGDIVFGALLVAIAMLGAALNVFLMLAILPNPRMRSVRQVLLVHLGVVGLLTSLILTLPAGVLQLITALHHGVGVSGSEAPQLASINHVTPSSLLLPSTSQSSLQNVPLLRDLSLQVEQETEGVALGEVIAMSGPLCTVIGTCGVLLTSGSVWTVAALAWDKHRAIANPLHHPLVARRQTMAAWFAVLWALAAALATPPVFGGGDLRFVPALSRCGMHAGSDRGRWHALLVVAVGVVTPLSLMIYCYTHIFRIARAQSSRIAATMLRMVTLIQAPIAPPPARSAGMVKLRGTRAMATIVQLVGSCVASYVPWVVLLCHQAVSSITPHGLPANTAAILLHAAPLTAATVYGLRNRNLRASFARFVSRRLQQWCRAPHRRRPSVKSLTRNSSSAMFRKQPAQNGLSPPLSGLRRTFSWQTQRRGMMVGGSVVQGGPDSGGGLREASQAFLPRPHSYSVLTHPHPYHNHHLALPAGRDALFLHEQEVSDFHDVLEINSEFPAIELDMNSEYPGILERETVT